MITNFAPPSLLLYKTCIVCCGGIDRSMGGKTCGSFNFARGIVVQCSSRWGKGKEEGWKGWLGGLDDMSPYFKSRITNALACAPPHECRLDGGCGVDMFRTLI